MKKLLLTTAVLALTGSLALAAVSTDDIVTDLQAQGYTWSHRGQSRADPDEGRGHSRR